MAYTDAEVALEGIKNLLVANSAFVAALGSYLGSPKVYRDTIPQGVTLPAVALAKSGFMPQDRPLRQGGANNQIWSMGTVTVEIVSDDNYSPNLVRLMLNALDNQSYYAVAGAGEIKWIRWHDDNDQPVTIGERVWKLTRINFDVAAKAT